MARTRVPCIGRQILNHCATREALFFFLFRDELVWYFSIAKYMPIIRYSENMENQKDEDKVVILALPQRKVFWYISL